MHTTRISFIKQLCNNESDAWNQLQQLYQPMIRQWLRRFPLQANDAEDLTQEVMLVLAKQVDQFEHSGNVGAFRNWLRTTTVNLTHNYLRKNKRHTTGQVGSDTLEDMANQLADPNSQMSRHFDIEHDRFVVGQLLSNLKDKFEPTTLEIFRKHVLHGASVRETAEAMNTTIANVHTAKSRVMRQLRAEAADLFNDLSLF